MIQKISLGKKPIMFLDYEAVIENSNNIQQLVSVNIILNGKILTKIKTNVSLQNRTNEHLEKLIIETIAAFVSQSVVNEVDIIDDSKFRIRKSDNQQNNARQHAAQQIFTDFNL